MADFEEVASEGVLASRRLDEPVRGLFPSAGEATDPSYQTPLDMDIKSAYHRAKRTCKKRITNARLWSCRHRNSERCASSRPENYVISTQEH